MGPRLSSLALRVPHLDPCRITYGVRGEEHPAGWFRLIVGFRSSRLAENLEGPHLLAQTVPQGPSESELGKLSEDAFYAGKRPNT